MKKRILSFQLLCAGMTLLVVSCGSPSSDGKKFAKKENAITERTAKKLAELDEQFTTGFDAGNYTSRQAAKDDWTAQRRDIADQYALDIDKLYGEIKQAARQLDGKKLYKFETAYREHIDRNRQNDLGSDLMISDIPHEVLASIATINPARPDVAKITADLANRTLNDVEGGYFFEAKRLINLADYDISNLQISEVVKDEPSEYIATVSLSIAGRVNADRRMNATCKIRYTLPRYDDWTVDFVRTESLAIISCDTYSSCVKVVRADYGLTSLQNVCDKSLEVFVNYFKYGQWNKRIIVAKPQGEISFCYSPEECKIDYILPL